MRFENVFQDICDTLSEEERVMNEAAQVMFDMDTQNMDFFESTDMIDDVYTEGVDIKGMAARAKETVVKAVRFLIEQIKKFAKMIADRVSDFLKKREIKSLLKKAKADAKNYPASAKTTIQSDPLKIMKLNQEYNKSCIRFMERAISDFKSGKMTDEKLEKCQHELEKANDKYNKECARWMDREVEITYNQGLIIAEKAEEFLDNNRDVKEMEDKLSSVARELESWGFDIYNPVTESAENTSMSVFDKFMESFDASDDEDDTVVTESVSHPVAPSKFTAFLDAIVATFRNNKGKCITAILQDAFAILFATGAVQNLSNGNVISSAIGGGIAVGLGAPGSRKTAELSKDIYKRYKNTKISE